MRKRISRRPGRPRGKSRPLADFKLLEYLVLISMKYGIDPDDLFNSFVDAWKHQQSTCKGLLIERRERTRDSAVFLITDTSKVVAQFPIPRHILEEASPIKEFVRTSALRRKKIKRVEVDNLRIGDLKSGMNRINLKARVVEIPKPRSVITRFGAFATVANASVRDETGMIQLPLWNKQINTVSVGDTIRVENARVINFKGERQLRVGRSGRLSVIEKR